ncbi:MAG TPA: hypothetical protein VG938_00035 [Verrucomicrobiae bacterium]|nr:hypothetical protein [Verrucomicrobiae bacterium]
MSELPANDASSAKPPGETASPGTPAANPTASSEQPAAGQLTKEEQWALFEKELKENDWGHQPC